MATWTSNLPVFMGLDAWTIRQDGYWIAHADPNDQWAIYIASNGPVRAACVYYDSSHSHYSILYVSSIENCSGYLWGGSGMGKRSENLSNYDVRRGLYYANSSQLVPYGFTGYPFIGIFETVEDALSAYTPISPNPYSSGGTSGPGGGNGSFSPTSDSIDFPSVPVLSATDAGFVSLWIPTPVELRNLARYMWNTDILTTDFWKKLVGDPIDLILSLAIYPTIIDTEENTAMVTVGYTNTGVAMHYRASQYIDVDCGTLSIPEYWAAYMDYAPYTRVSIFLPYIGTKPLNTDDVMNQDLSIRYRIDLVSGSCVAMIKVGDRIMYQFSGTCATAIPVSSEQMGNIIRATVSLGTALGATAAAVASGGVTAGVAADAISSAANLATSKPDVAHSSHVGAAAGLLSVQTPYLIIERPRQAIPEDQQTYTGFPSFITEDLGELTGYTEVEAIHLHDMTCTDDERAEIDELLKEGVIF